MHVKSAIRIRIFTFYLFKAEQYTSGRVQNVGCVYYCCCSYYAAARYTWKSKLAVVDFDWCHLIAKPSTRTSVRCKDFGDICCTSRGIVHFVLNFVFVATRVGRSKIQLAAFDGPFPKTPSQMQKVGLSQISFTQAELWLCGIRLPIPQKILYRHKNLAEISYASRVIANFVPNFVAMATGVGRGEMRLAAFDGPSP